MQVQSISFKSNLIKQAGQRVSQNFVATQPQKPYDYEISDRAIAKKHRRKEIKQGVLKGIITALCICGAIFMLGKDSQPIIL